MHVDIPNLKHMLIDQLWKLYTFFLFTMYVIKNNNEKRCFGYMQISNVTVFISLSKRHKMFCKVKILTWIQGFMLMVSLIAKYSTSANQICDDLLRTCYQPNYKTQECDVFSLVSLISKYYTLYYHHVKSENIRIRLFDSLKSVVRSKAKYLPYYFVSK
jgi:hypothetical protein